MRHKWKSHSYKRLVKSVSICACGCKRILALNVDNRWGMHQRYYIQPNGTKTTKAGRCTRWHPDK